MGPGGELVWDREPGEMVISVPRPQGMGNQIPASFRDVIVITKAGFQYNLFINQVGIIR